jgi:ABC-type transport system involved in Fe-S cluster assembly fused permease/ATPase subunit
MFAGASGLRLGSAALLRDALQHMWSVSDRSAKRLIAVTLSLTLASAIVVALSPTLLQLLVDTLARGRAAPFSIAPAYLALAYASAHWLSRSLKESRGLFLGRADQRVYRLLSDRFFRHIMSLSLPFHLNRKTGALSQTLTNGLVGYSLLLHHLINSILPVLIELATMGAVLALLGHSLFLAIAAISVGLYAIAFWMAALRIRDPAREASGAHIAAGALFTDSILNYETVKYFNGESLVHGRFIAALTSSEDRWTRLYRRKAENGVVVATIFAGSLGLSVYVAARAVQHGTMSLGEFVLVNAYMIQLTRPLEMLGFAFRDIVQGVAFIERMSELLVMESPADLSGDHRFVSFDRKEFEFDNISFAYDANRRVLHNVSFVVPSGKTLAIVGPSGSGKSSIIRLLLRMWEPDKGQILLGGVPLPNISVSALRDAIAVVPQDTTLFNDSIAYNIGFGRRGSTREEIVEAATVAGIHESILRLPDGYDTVVGERGLRLSGGEKQRVAIARAVIKQPNMFVFDEATSSLDSKTERAILKSLAAVSENTTTLIVAHRLSTVVHADEIAVLDDGCIVGRGTHDMLMRQGGVYEAMWRAQNRGFRCCEHTNEIAR